MRGGPGIRGENGLEGEEGGPGRDFTLNMTSAIGGGTTYIRWGRISCPDTAELVYQGEMFKMP